MERKIVVNEKLFQKIKNPKHTYKSRRGNLLTEDKDTIDRWKGYLQELLNAEEKQEEKRKE